MSTSEKQLEAETKKKEQYKKQLLDEREEFNRRIKETEERGLNLKQALLEQEEERKRQQERSDELERDKQRLLNELEQIRQHELRREAAPEDLDMDAMQQIAEALRLLTANQISSESGKTLAICRQTVIDFKKENVRNFLNSVGSAYEAVQGEDQKLRVLDYAKTRVGSDILISNKIFESLDDFEQDVLRQFRPAQDHLQLNQEIMLLRQGEDDIHKYGKKATDLQAKYTEALYASYRAKNLHLDVGRIMEAEALITRQFVIGLKRNTREFIRTEPENLAMAISLATSAATSATLSQMMYNNQSGGASKNPRNGQETRKWDDKKNQKSKFVNKWGNNNSNGNGGGFKNGANSQNNKGRNDKGERVCFNCGLNNHLVADCKKPKTVQNNRNSQEPQAARAFQASSSQEGGRNYASEGARPKNETASSVDTVSGSTLKLRRQR